MGEHEDHGPVATHPVLLGIAGVAFLVLMVLGFKLKSASGHHGVQHSDVGQATNQQTSAEH